MIRRLKELRLFSSDGQMQGAIREQFHGTE